MSAKKRIVLAYSGGLDTSYLLKRFSKECYEVHAVSVNTGGFSEQDTQVMESKAMQMGAHVYKNINALDNFYEDIVKYLIFGNVLRNNTYPLSVSAERMTQAMAIVAYAKEHKADYIAHGSTAAGNDQIRFDMVFQIMAPEIEVLTPVRDESLSREVEIAYLKEHGIDMSWEKAKYSINQGLWGTSVGGVETLTSHEGLPNEAYPSQLEIEEPMQLELEFVEGELFRVNEVKGDPVSLIEHLQELAKKYAIGRDIHVGDTIIGIKGRVGFEAAAPTIIIKAHHLLEKHTLTKWQHFQKDQMSNFYGMLLHEGQYLDPVMRDIEAFLESSQGMVSGTVFVELHPYRFELKGVDSPHDLMTADFASYGESGKAWSAEDAKGFIKLLGNSSKIFEHVNGQENDK